MSTRTVLRSGLQSAICAILIATLAAEFVHAGEFPAGPAASSQATTEGSQGLGIRLESFLEMPAFLFLMSVNGGAASTYDTQNRVQYNPTFGPNIGLKASFAPISVSWATRIKPGETRFTDLRFAAARGNWAGDVYYQKYDGFRANLNATDGLSVSSGSDRVESPSRLDPGVVPRAPEHIINRPDIQSRHYGAIAYRAVPLYPSSTEARSFDFIFQSGEPPEFAFDFLVNGYVNHLSIAGSSPLVPPERQEQFGEGAQAHALSMNAGGVGAGAAFIMGFRPTYVSLLVLAGGGLQHRTVELAEDRFSGFGLIESMNARIGFGTRRENRSFDVNIVWDVWRSSVKNVRLDSSNIGLLMSYAVRI